jgi:hypothetical protein
MLAHLVSGLFLILLFATPAICAEPRDPFYSPITGFADALVPILTGFEKTRVETTLRGFIARADSFPGFQHSEMEPSEHGLYLNVAVRDSGEVKGFADHTEQRGAVTHRLVQIPPPKGGEQAIVIEWDCGREVPTKVIRAIDSCVSGVVRFSKQSNNDKR